MLVKSKRNLKKVNKMNYELYHYGILGMHWGIRRYQNPDGSLTPAGKKRYRSQEAAEIDRNLQYISKKNKILGAARRKLPVDRMEDDYNKAMDEKRPIVDKMFEIVDTKYPEYKKMIDKRKEIRGRLDPLLTNWENGIRNKSLGDKIDALRAQEFYLSDNIERMSEKITKDLLDKVGDEKAYGPFANKTTKGRQFVLFLEHRGYVW